MQEVLTSDVLAALLVHLEPEDGADPRFEGSPTLIHAALQKVADEFPVLLGDISFGRPGSFPRSPAIAGALDTLTMDGFLSCANPDLVVYTVRRTVLQQYFDSYLAATFEEAELLADLPRAAELFLESLEEVRASGASELVTAP